MGSCLFVLLIINTYAQCLIWKNSIALWSWNIEKDPRSHIPYNSRGHAYMTKGDLDLAMADFNQAIIRYPGYSDAYNNRALLYYRRGNYDAALEDFNKAIAANPQNPEAYNNRGIVYARENRFELALRDFNSAILYKKKYFKAYNRRGVDRKTWEQSRSVHKAFIRESMNVDPYYYNRANLYRQQGLYDLAADDYVKAVEFAPNY